MLCVSGSAVKLTAKSVYWFVMQQSCNADLIIFFRGDLQWANMCIPKVISRWYATSSGSKTKGQICWAEAFPSHSHQTAKILQQGMYFFGVYFCSVWRAQHNNSDSCHSALHLCYWPVFKHCFSCRHEPTRLSGNSCRQTITARKICNYSISKRQHGSTWMHHVQQIGAFCQKCITQGLGHSNVKNAGWLSDLLIQT